MSFFCEHIKNRFDSRDFVFDVVRTRKDRVKLVDFNPFGLTTDSILFSWQELEEFDPTITEVEFRLSFHIVIMCETLLVIQVCVIWL